MFLTCAGTFVCVFGDFTSAGDREACRMARYVDAVFYERVW